MHKNSTKQSLNVVLQQLPDETLEPTTSQALWEKIDANLTAAETQLKTTTLANKRNNQVSYWSLAAAMFVCAIGLFWILQNEQNFSSNGLPLNAQTTSLTETVDSVTNEQLLLVLQNRSKFLEAGLRQLPTPNILSGQQAVMMDELERMIGLVDLQLNASTANQPDSGQAFVQQQFERTALWQQRIDLMQSLVTTRLDAHRGGYADNPWQSAASSMNVSTGNYY